MACYWRDPGGDRRGSGLPTRRLGPQRRWATALILIALLGFALVLLLVRYRSPIALDLRVTRGLQRLENPALSAVLVAVTWLGWQPQQTLIAAVPLGLFFLTRRRVEGTFLVLALAIGALNDLLKLAIRRPRPSAALDDILVHGHVLGTSFPSGHVLTYVLFYGFLAYVTYTQVRRPLLRWGLLLPMLVLLALIGPSRVYLGHHWFTDTVASYLLGGALLIGLLLAYRSVRGRRVVPVPGPG